MPIFNYIGKDSTTQKTVRGRLVAESETILGDLLRQQGVTLMKTTAASDKKGDPLAWIQRLRGVPVVQKIFFTQNLGVMLRGGFSISRAMATLALQTSHAYFRQIILSMQQDVESGMTFSQSLTKYPHVFPDMFVNMIAAGEVSGKLDEVLKLLTNQMKKDHQLIGKVKGAMTYPVVVIVAMIGAGVAMIVFVIPKLLDVFKQNNAQLPLPTRVLIAISDAFQHQGFLILGGLIVIVTAFVMFGRTIRGHRIYDAVILSAPIAGPIVKKINLARFTRSLSSMLATDIPIIQSFHIIGRTLGSVHYRQSIEDASQALKTGASIAKVLARYPKLYPPLVQQMVSVGEESGTLDEVSGELAIFYEEEVDQTMGNLATIIEPVLLLVLGVAVAGMAVAILLPMYNLTEQIN